MKRLNSGESHMVRQSTQEKSSHRYFKRRERVRRGEGGERESEKKRGKKMIFQV